MAIRFLHLSDLDLGARPSFLGEAADARMQEILETFRRAISFTLDPENRIDGVLISGNLFDRHRPPADVWAFVRGPKSPRTCGPSSEDSSVGLRPHRNSPC